MVGNELKAVGIEFEILHIGHKMIHGCTACGKCAKVAAGVVAVRRTGGSVTLDSLNHYLTYSEMIVATSNYWNVIHGTNSGEVNHDGEGKQIMRVLGKNMVWLLKMKEATASKIEPPKKEKKEYTNFIR